MVRKTDNLGGYYHEPPYTEEEIDKNGGIAHLAHHSARRSALWS
jgi:hypothetical protein